MKSSSYWFVMVALTVISCKHDEEERVEPLPSPPAGARLVAGDTVGMIVRHYEQVLDAPLPHGSAELTLDVDENGSADLLIYFYSTYTLGAGNQTISYIRTLDPGVRLVGQLVEEIHQYRVDTLGQYISGGHVVYNLILTSGCSLGDDAITLSIVPDQYRLKYLQPGDSLTSTVYNVEDSLLVRREPTHSSPYTNGTDTMYTWNSVGLQNCHPCPLGVPSYLAFRVDDGLGAFRLGWLYFTYLDPHRIIVHSTAVQQ